MEDNVVIENVEFSEELYQKNIQDDTFEIEYEGGNIDANNECNDATE